MTKQEKILQMISDAVYMEENNSGYIHFIREDFKEMQHFLAVLSCPINEKELDELAKESMVNYGGTCLSSFDNSDSELMMEGYYQGYKVGFHEAKEL